VEPPRDTGTREEPGGAGTCSCARANRSGSVLERQVSAGAYAEITAEAHITEATARKRVSLIRQPRWIDCHLIFDSRSPSLVPGG